MVLKPKTWGLKIIFRADDFFREKSFIHAATIYVIQNTVHNVVIAVFITVFLWSYIYKPHAINDKDKVKSPRDLHHLLRETNHDQSAIEKYNIYFVIYDFSPTSDTVASSISRKKRYGTRVNDLVCINEPLIITL